MIFIQYRNDEPLLNFTQSSFLKEYKGTEQSGIMRNHIQPHQVLHL